jgi:hypothetical protein
MRLKLLPVFMLGISMLLAACGEEARTPAATAPATSVEPSLPPPTVELNGPTPTPVKPSEGGVTLKKAHETADKLVKAWHADAFYTAVYNPPDTGYGIDAAGKSLQWYFETFSPSTAQRATWLVQSTAEGNAAAAKSIEDTLDKERAQLLENRKLPDFGTLIDTDRLMEVARQNGGGKSDRPVGLRLAKPPKEGDPLAVDLLFNNGGKVLRLRIDMQSGKPVDNTKG